MGTFRKLIKYAILFLIGGLVYFLIEILWRGYSHWTMFVVGGLCFVLIGEINKWFTWKMPLWQQCCIAALIITALELVTGCIVNLWLDWNVWDYYSMPFNLLGQICLPMVVAWIFLSTIGIFLDDFIRWKLFCEDKPRYILF